MEKRYNIDLGIAQTLEDFTKMKGSEEPGHTVIRSKTWLDYPLIEKDSDIDKLKYIYPSIDDHTLQLHDFISKNHDLMIWGIKPTIVRS